MLCFQISIMSHQEVIAHLKPKPMAYGPAPSQPNPMAYGPGQSQPKPMAYGPASSQPKPMAYGPGQSQPKPMAYGPASSQPKPMAYDPALSHQCNNPPGEGHSKPAGATRVAAWDGSSHRMSFEDHEKSYGTPMEGTRSEARGFRAGHDITEEVYELCENIMMSGQPHPDGTFTVRFGPLFQLYTRISNKVVGMLLRARRHKLVTFEGEMLFQRRDDDKVITLVSIPAPLEPIANQILNEYFGQQRWWNNAVIYSRLIWK